MSALVQNLDTYIFDPIIAIIFVFGLLVFVWGIIEFLLALNELGGYSKEDGKRHMFYGVVGMFVMVSAWALVQFLASNICGGITSCYPLSLNT